MKVEVRKSGRIIGHVDITQLAGKTLILPIINKSNKYEVVEIPVRTQAIIYLDVTKKSQRQIDLILKICSKCKLALDKNHHNCRGWFFGLNRKAK